MVLYGPSIVQEKKYDLLSFLVEWGLKYSPAQPSKPLPSSQHLVAAGIAPLKFPVFLSLMSFIAGSYIERAVYIDLEDKLTFLGYVRTWICRCLQLYYIGLPI